MVEVAHDNDMKIEAWVNPYRVTTGSTNYKKLAKNNQARKMACQEVYKKKCIILWWKFVLQPIQESGQNTDHKRSKRNRKNYDVDGIHMDDYFYPSFTKT